MPPLPSTLSRRLTCGTVDANGSAAVEFGMIAPLLLLMAVATADLGVGIYRKMQVENAARAGAEHAIRNGFDSNAIAAVVAGTTSFPGINPLPAPSQFCGCASIAGVTAVTCGGGCPGGASPGTYVAISAQGTYSTILPYFGLPNSFTFTAQSTVRLQ